jgi:GntR family transcriptional regulator/MocR family aminotransferase
MVKRAGGALLLSVRIDHESSRPVSTQLYVILRDLILSGGVTAATSRSRARPSSTPSTA